MITAIYVHIVEKQLWKKVTIFSLSIIFAIIGNAGRIFTIIVIAKLGYPDFAGGLYHDYSGFVFFPIALSVMLLTSKLLNLGSGDKAQPRARRKEENRDQTASLPAGAPRRLASARSSFYRRSRTRPRRASNFPCRRMSGIGTASTRRSATSNARSSRRIPPSRASSTPTVSAGRSSPRSSFPGRIWITASIAPSAASPRKAGGSPIRKSWPSLRPPKRRARWT